MIRGLYNVNQSVASQVNDVTMLASDAGGDYSQKHNGILLNLSARPRNGLAFQGGVGTGTDATNYCDVRAAAPEYTVLGAQSPDQSVVQHLHRVDDALHGSRLLHHSEGGRAGLGHVPQRQGLAAGGQHGLHVRRRRRSAGHSPTTRRT